MIEGNFSVRSCEEHCLQHSQRQFLCHHQDFCSGADHGLCSGNREDLSCNIDGDLSCNIDGDLSCATTGMFPQRYQSAVSSALPE